MKILLIGGCGYVGSALGNYLQKDHDITNVDLEWFGNYSTGQSINIDYKHLTESFLEQFNVVILTAGHSSVKMCDTDLQSSFYNNVLNFVNLTKKLTTQKFIYASSASVYGNTSASEIAEDNVNFSPINYYDMTKLHIDHIIQLSNLDYYGLRFGTVNGPAPSIRTDVMINAMVNTAKQKGEIHVFNKDTRRSILGISDLCRAVEAIINNNKKASRGIYNTASFTNTAGEIADAVGKIAGVPVIDKDPPSVIFNEKLQNKTYDFGISTSKFENTFDFKFTDTLDGITQEMVDQYAKCNRDHRAELIHYT